MFGQFASSLIEDCADRTFRKSDSYGGCSVDRYREVQLLGRVIADNDGYRSVFVAICKNTVKPATSLQTASAGPDEVAQLFQDVLSNLRRTGNHPTLSMLVELTNMYSLTIEGAHRLFGYDLGAIRECDLRLNGGRTHIELVEWRDTLTKQGKDTWPNAFIFPGRFGGPMDSSNYRHAYCTSWQTSWGCRVDLSGNPAHHCPTWQDQRSCQEYSGHDASFEGFDDDGRVHAIARTGGAFDYQLDSRQVGWQWHDRT